MSRIDWRGMKLPVGSYSALIAVVTGIAAEFGNVPMTNSFLASGILCLFHLVFGFIILESSFDRSPTTFLKRVLGGMGVRLSVMLIALALMLRSPAFDELWLLLGLLLWYAVALTFEISAMNKKVSLKQDHSA